MATAQPHPDWNPLVVANGVLDGEPALESAAVLGLVARGSTLEQAADQLGLSGDSRRRVLASVRQVR